VKEIMGQLFITKADPKKVDEFAARPPPKPICNTVNKAKLVEWLNTHLMDDDFIRVSLMNKIKSGEWDV